MENQYNLRIIKQWRLSIIYAVLSNGESVEATHSHHSSYLVTQNTCKELDKNSEQIIDL